MRPEKGRVGLSEDVMEKMLTVALAGLGNRGLYAYGNELHRLQDSVKVTAVADIDPEKVNSAKELFSLDEAHCFSSAEALLAQPQLADVLFITTQDRQHVDHAIPALHAGYDVVLEKPISPDAAEIQALLEAKRQTGKQVIVCHVLRYTPFYNTIKDLLDAGTVGTVMNIQAIENVGYYHHAHSFVRGNWRRSDTTSPMILQKCCHDFDIFLWLTGGIPQRVSSFGALSFFTAANAPEGAADYCMDGCKAKDACVFDAEKIYLTNPRTGFLQGNSGWPNDVVAFQPTEQKLRDNLNRGPYGRCVYRCDNTVVDHQVVNVELSGNILINFTMSAFSPDVTRVTKIMGTSGCILADTGTNTITVAPFGKKAYQAEIAVQSAHSGHGGGDGGLVREAVDYFLHPERKSVRLSSLEVSVGSHLIALAAETSRLENGKVIPINVNTRALSSVL